MGQKVAFVSGAATGLGHAVVQSLVQDGWDICFTYRKSKEPADQLMEYAAAHGRRAHSVKADLLSFKEVQRAAVECLRLFGRVDAFIHNFGPFTFKRSSLSDLSDDEWKRMMDGNLNNFMWAYPLFVPGMRARRFGRIVTVGFAGAGSAEGWKGRAAYAAAKSGLASLTRSIAKEEAGYGITANMVCPGDIRGAHKHADIEQVSHLHGMVSRPAVGEDIGRLVTFLCDEKSQMMTGTVMEVTGGAPVVANDEAASSRKMGPNF